MKSALVFVGSVTLFLISCSRTGVQNTELTSEDTVKHPISLPQQVHNKVSIKRYFSNPKLQDEFILLLKGKDYKTADLVFCILNANHDTLFFRTSYGKVLLSRGSDQKLSPEQELEMIQQNMSTFFANTGFSNPPYTLNDPTKSEFSGDLLVWEEIKNDSSAWCFEFSLLENGRSEVIAYSRIKDSILVYDQTP